MSRSNFPRVAAAFLALVALAHAWRAVEETPLLIGVTPIPVWTSWLAAAVTGALSVWGFRTRS
ncbi:MAG: hypothetical protein KBF21_17885 [Thermoanaerobaculia bacterium]|nr:hypothetical protein [Thermoanaerobaculia bacterium]MBP9826104.1 hypothetical protein [Thermoanaerobaculia bacterium]